MSVCGAAQCTSRGDSYATFAFVPMISSGLPHHLHVEPALSFSAVEFPISYHTYYRCPTRTQAVQRARPPLASCLLQNHLEGRSPERGYAKPPAEPVQASAPEKYQEGRL
ncbi:hypothetical protein EVAR_59564_1 [Eumeta japonica]|uniref:Uncharacterized protein n=1 Tax=Eumeta variegata TaxID=151549 RepID=A0A4C1YVD2_EUMVA|nr:hypothetical protein EVAR_59564_1 [Eumeta japonica]